MGNIIAEFMKDQIGEKVKSIETFQYHNTVVVYFSNCFNPAEEDLINSERKTDLLRELKYNLLEQVKPLLKGHLEESLDLNIIKIKSLIGPGGDRVLYITLGEKIQKIPQKTTVQI